MTLVETTLPGVLTIFLELGYLDFETLWWISLHLFKTKKECSTLYGSSLSLWVEASKTPLKSSKRRVNFCHRLHSELCSCFSSGALWSWISASRSDQSQDFAHIFYSHRKPTSLLLCCDGQHCCPKHHSVRSHCLIATIWTPKLGRQSATHIYISQTFFPKLTSISPQKNKSRNWQQQYKICKHMEIKHFLEWIMDYWRNYKGNKENFILTNEENTIYQNS